jgi:hypothetical protein
MLLKTHIEKMSHLCLSTMSMKLNSLNDALHDVDEKKGAWATGCGLARFSHQLLGTSCEGTENLDDGLTGMLAKSKKRLRTIAGDDGLVFGSCAP